MKNKSKAFTLVEILAVIVVLGILTTVIVAAISGYMQKGKDEYDENLEKQLLLSGKNYFADKSFLLPEDGETSYVTLAQLKGLNIVSKDFVDAYGTKCSNSDSLVRVSNNKGKYTYTACLVCEGNDKFGKDHLEACKPKINEINPDDNLTKTCSIRIDANGEYQVYGKNGNSEIADSKIDAVKKYNKMGCNVADSCNQGVIRINDNTDNIKYWVNSNKEIVDENAYENDAKCNPTPPPTCSFDEAVGTGYKKTIIEESTINNVSDLITKMNNSISTLDNNKSYYKYYIKNSTFDNVSKKSSQSTTKPSYVTNGSNATTDEYFTKATKKTLVKSTPYSYIHLNKSIPSEYSFLIGNSNKKVTYTIPSSLKMSTSNIKKWGTEFYNQVEEAKVVEANKNAINNYKARYYNVGKYNGQSVDVEMVLTGYSGCKLRKGASICGLWFESDKLGVYSLGVYRISVKYNFYKAGTNTPITVKGYTTYWDIDANQGIHFVQNTTGLYAYGTNKLYVRSLNSAPYVYEYNDDTPIGYNGGYAITETFYGNSMKKTFTFASGSNGDHSKITSSNGEIWHSTSPIGITKSYLGSAENSVFEKGDTVQFTIRYSNATEKEQKFKITDTLKGMTYEKGTAKNEKKNLINPTISGNNLTWSGTIKPFTTHLITYAAKINSCGDLIETSAKMTLGGATYSTDILNNAVICKDKISCK